MATAVNENQHIGAMITRSDNVSTALYFVIAVGCVFCHRRCDFTMVPTEKLIELVKKYPILYDLSHEDYKNIRKKDKIWDEIGQEMKECREELKRRWRSLRDSYVRYLRVIKTRTGQGAQNKTWQWAE
uniref:Uncharacterized protein LOC114348126 n=1 Tax=Diabrotica virgifera virgifera TaxID=50390 RepID=A0A6P7GYP1_DIAVI